ncbi:hypothetical protein AB8810_23095 [Xanthomonas sp. NCPPB 3005]|uniref:hypothetical protein n=1 Tax=Xanthomonas sp. NCPPB 3005 TaxID=3240913 RepID=UPI00351781B1
MDGFSFTSTLFEIERGEDAQLNPGRYGRQLALWLEARFAQLGYASEIVEEDWGYCVMLSRDPLLLWIGCGNMDEADIDASKDAIVWRCFAVAEASLLQKLFRRPQTRGALQKLQAELHAVLDEEPEIALIELQA